MTTQAADVYELLRKIRYDCTSIQAKVTDVLNMLAEMNLPDQPTAACPMCGHESRGPQTLAEHVYTSHNGPLPPHWERLDARALEPESPLDFDLEVATAREEKP